MPVRKPPQRSEDQLPNGHMSESFNIARAESIMHQRNPPQRSEDQLPNGHLLKRIEIRH